MRVGTAGAVEGRAGRSDSSRGMIVDGVGGEISTRAAVAATNVGGLVTDVMTDGADG